MKSTIEQAAQQLLKAEKTKSPCDPVRALIGAQNVDDAYAVQNVISRQKEENGARTIGKKIGLTSVAVQQQLGVDQPDYGALFDKMQVLEGETISVTELMQPKAEAEIAFVLKKDLTTGNFSLTEIEEAIDYAVAAIEIVGSRIKNWDIRIADTIADNASASHFVLGTVRKKLSEIDVVGATMQLTKNEVLVSEGTGAACLGSPLIATQWLANKMVEMGTPLQKGDIVLSGALGPMTAVEAGDLLKAKIEGLGEVSIRFTA